MKALLDYLYKIGLLRKDQYCLFQNENDHRTDIDDITFILADVLQNLSPHESYVISWRIIRNFENIQQIKQKEQQINHSEKLEFGELENIIQKQSNQDSNNQSLFDTEQINLKTSCFPDQNDENNLYSEQQFKSFYNQEEEQTSINENYFQNEQNDNQKQYSEQKQELNPEYQQDIQQEFQSESQQNQKEQQIAANIQQDIVNNNFSSLDKKLQDKNQTKQDTNINHIDKKQIQTPQNLINLKESENFKQYQQQLHIQNLMEKINISQYIEKNDKKFNQTAQTTPRTSRYSVSRQNSSRNNSKDYQKFSQNSQNILQEQRQKVQNQQNRSFSRSKSNRQLKTGANNLDNDENQFIKNTPTNEHNRYQILQKKRQNLIQKIKSDLEIIQRKEFQHENSFKYLNV